MIRPLRKMHRMVFLTLTPALPLLFFGGLASRHAPPATSAQVPVVIGPTDSAVREGFLETVGSVKYRFRVIEYKTETNQSEYQFVCEPHFMAPDVLVYWSEKEQHSPIGKEAQLLGKFSSRARYRTSTRGYLVLYSLAQNQVLGSMALGAAR